jgi:zinc D-Ala-D-Ala carboxypeptidase
MLRLTRLAGLLVVIAASAAALTDGLSTPSTAAPNVAVAPPESPAGTVAPVEDDEDDLDAELADALRAATADAADEGVQLFVQSGRRSPEHQQQLFDEAVAKYGSQAEAARWVATPETSAHVSGDAVDIGPAAGAAWLSEHGAAYGLCQIYRNEPWHFELRAETGDFGCPQMYEDPTHDPRLQ